MTSACCCGIILEAGAGKTAARPDTGRGAGCSKTRMAQAAAGGSGMRLQALAGAQLFSMYVGEGEALLRDAFQRARLTAPAIIFIDEIDAIVGAFLLLHPACEWCLCACSYAGPWRVFLGLSCD